MEENEIKAAYSINGVISGSGSLENVDGLKSRNQAALVIQAEVAIGVKRRRHGGNGGIA